MAASWFSKKIAFQIVFNKAASSWLMLWLGLVVVFFLSLFFPGSPNKESRDPWVPPLKRCVLQKVPQRDDPCMNPFLAVAQLQAHLKS